MRWICAGLWLALLVVTGAAVRPLPTWANDPPECEAERSTLRTLVGVVTVGRERAELELARMVVRVRALEVEIERLKAGERK